MKHHIGSGQSGPIRTVGEKAPATVIMMATFQQFLDDGAKVSPQEAFDCAPIAMLILDRDMRVLAANRAAAAIGGLPVGATAGLRPGEVVFCNHRSSDPGGCGFASECVSCILRAQAVGLEEPDAGHSVGQVTCRIKKGNATAVLTLRATLVPLPSRADGAMLACFEDITELKEAELRFRTMAQEIFNSSKEVENAQTELRTANANLERRVEGLLGQKKALLDMLYQDLRTPLTPLMSILPLLEEDEPDPRRRELLHVASVVVNGLNGVVCKHLRLAKIDNFNSNHQLEHADLGDEIESVVTERGAMMAERHIKVTNNVQKGFVVGRDPQVIHDILAKLLDNAMDVTNAGGNIAMGARRRAGELILTCADDGVGMTPAECQRVGTKFNRADVDGAEAKYRDRGLAECQRLVERHGGTLSAESPGPGHGSMFMVTIPVRDVPAPAGGKAR